MTHAMTDESTDDDASNTHWHPRTIARRYDKKNSLTDLQRDMLATAIRNPDANVPTIADHVEDEGDSVGRSALFGALRHVHTGGFEVGDYPGRLNRGHHGWKDLTVKQRAVLDTLARHPNAFDAMTWARVADLVEEATGVSVSHTTPYQYKNRYPDHLTKRREWYESQRPDAVEELPDGYEPEVGIDFGGDDDGNHVRTRPVRYYLERADIDDLPGENLDSLPTVEERIADVDSRRGERAGSTQAANDAAGHPDEPKGPTAHDTDEKPDSDDAGRTYVPGNAKPETVERKVGSRSYKGPDTGLDLTGGAPVKYLSEPASESIEAEIGSDALAELRERDGLLGEKAHEHTVSIDDREDLEREVRQLRLLVSAQASVMRRFERALDSITINVGVEYDGLPKHMADADDDPDDDTQ